MAVPPCGRNGAEYVERAIEGGLKILGFPTIRLIRSRTATIPACGCGSIRWKAM